MVFHINNDKSDELPFFAMKLKEEEVESLPFEIIYSGNDEIFEADEKEAFTIIVKIIELMNLMQDEEWFSYPLGKLL